MDVQPGGGERVDAGHDADRRHRHLPPAECAERIAGDAAHGLDHGVEIHQRLAYAHEHDHLQPAARRVRLAAEREKLLHDFAGGQVALEAGLRRRAKIAAHRAADLQGNATRRTVRAKIRHEHRLHRAPVAEPEE